VTIRVVLADDHPMFRYGLRAVLDEAEGIDVIGEAADGAELLALVAENDPDVVLTDLAMDGVDGVAVISSLAKQRPSLPVLALSMHADDAHVRAALRAGAHGYLLKGADAEQITLAVRTVAAGQDAFDRTLTQRMVTAYAGDDEHSDVARAAFPDLSPRERDVLSHIADGCGNHEIARRIGLSEKTVRNLTSAVLMKLGVPDRTAAALRARDAGLGVRRQPRSHQDQSE
jgi:DNA-binding NarL/FixJ family response regulator